MTPQVSRRALVAGGLLSAGSLAAGASALATPAQPDEPASYPPEAAPGPIGPLDPPPGVSVRLRSSGQGLVATLEPTAEALGPLPLVVYHHGMGRDTQAILRRRSTAPIRAHLLATALSGYRVVVSDFGGFLWGNPRNHRAIDAVIATHRRTGGAPGRVALIGSSMGGAAVLSYAGTHRREVACVAALQPATDLVALQRQGVPVDAAFPGGFSNARHGDRANPTAIARDPRSLYRGIPIHVWTGTLDHIATPERVRRFATLVRRGPNPRIATTMLRGLPHGDLLVGAVPTEDLQGFLRRHLPPAHLLPGPDVDEPAGGTDLGGEPQRTLVTARPQP
ncbi:alpha/beta fold hydrolase [Nocardioides sp. zg-579]|uniref:Alpha/beta fold hydrolase n=1 Tax=Nocardioides marmotae TaxID=2663857 RepID=A0A6I3JFL0_9ACTN|nr:alpha/beta fold hydrolase [Nocardioides marmotae]MCR6033245.1 alpha/beta fold hydrolase [Gordonia jinghuaiqii]MTB96901.1 alpha/beta fold hydrolase [Nocardioides marmotae]QKE02912.1 alpha/beta fold hydrolase [Nocardioides marmotae]